MFKLVVLSMLNSTRITIYSIMMVIRAKHDDPRNRIRICRFRKFHRWSVYIGRYCTCRQHLRLRVCQHVRESSHSKHVYEISFDPANVSRGTQKIFFYWKSDRRTSSLGDNLFQHLSYSFFIVLSSYVAFRRMTKIRN